MKPRQLREIPEGFSDHRAVVAAVPGLTSRRLDHWTRRGYLTCYDATGAPDPTYSDWRARQQPGVGSGYWKLWADDDLRILRRVIELTSIGLLPGPAFLIARGQPLGADIRIEFTGVLA